jgi:hypothetical protein
MKTNENLNNQFAVNNNNLKNKFLVRQTKFVQGSPFVDP